MRSDPGRVSEAASVSELEAIEAIIAERRQVSDPPPTAPKAMAEMRRPAFTPMSPERERAMNEAYVEQIRAERRRQYDEKLASLKKAAGKRYESCTLDNYCIDSDQQARVVNALREYLESNGIDDGEGIVLYGPVGTGKDHLLYAVASQCVGVDFRVTWINGQDLFGEIRDRMDTDRPESTLLSTYTSAQLLVLSDPLPPFGSLTQHQATMLYRLMDDRASRKLPTFVSINVADDGEADERLGAATWDRMCDGVWKIRCAWPSFRKPVKEIA